MFGPSLKSVPGCLVSIVPMLIGVPVAFTPGFGPHDETLAALVGVAELLELLELEFELELELPLPLEELLLPQPARTSIPATAVSRANNRVRGHSWYVLTCLSSFDDEGTPAPVGQVGGILCGRPVACKRFLTRPQKSPFRRPGPSFACNV